MSLAQLSGSDSTLRIMLVYPRFDIIVQSVVNTLERLSEDLRNALMESLSYLTINEKVYVPKPIQDKFVRFLKMRNVSIDHAPFTLVYANLVSNFFCEWIDG